MSKRQAWILIAAAVWTIYVWVSRIVILAGQSNSAAFKAVHFTLAAISLAFAVAIGLIGLRARRGAP